MIERDQQYPSPNLTFREDMRSYNRSTQDKTPPDYGPREEFYRITPACDSDVSMRSVSKIIPASDNSNTGRAGDDLNGNKQLNEGQDLEGRQFNHPNLLT